MVGDALHGQMIALKLHTSGTKKSAKNSAVISTAVDIVAINNIPIVIDGKGFPSLAY